MQYFENSSKMHKFMELALKPVCPNTRHEKLKGSCKTRWVERHSCLETFGELYERVVTCLDAKVKPHVCPEVTESCWNSDNDTKTMAHGLKSTSQSFGVVVDFTVLKNILDYLKRLSAKLQRRDIGVLKHTVIAMRYNRRRDTIRGTSFGPIVVKKALQRGHKPSVNAHISRQSTQTSNVENLPMFSLAALTIVV